MEYELPESGNAWMFRQFDEFHKQQFCRPRKLSAPFVIGEPAALLQLPDDPKEMRAVMKGAVEQYRKDNPSFESIMQQLMRGKSSDLIPERR
ncbi:hypothetical protein [Paenibacillus polymyxa]|uniref:hypothetical protein n=1 Tax=Paenibacillus polymyxa TaxID=1406 RepID=UPI0025B6FF0F|nr:hypothetical protein [Paenibacillus polymyxa]MDN4090892.1 hypothetical protein [Paenibacillus polymyxa]